MTAVVEGATASSRSHRLRDLGRVGRIVAGLLGVLLLVPVVASAGRALADDWVPTGDDALIVLRAEDVLGGHPPLVGQPSTADTYASGIAARHPGPIEMYLLAVPVRLLGAPVGTLATAGALAGGSVLLAAWVALRRGGPAVGLVAALGLALVMWSTGTTPLTDPISSSVGAYPLLASCALAWALWCDDRRLWPVAVLVWSFTVQQHLATIAPAATVVVWGTIGAVASGRARRRREGLAADARAAGVALGVGFVAWLPPLIDQVAGSGNLGRIIEFGLHGERDGIGPEAGARVAARAIAFPPWPLRSSRGDNPNLAGWNLVHDLGPGEVAGVAIGVVLLAAVFVAAAVRRRRRASPPPAPEVHAADGGGGDVDAGASAARTPDRPIVTLAATALVLTFVGAMTASQVPVSVETGRISFYRWVWPASLAAWGAITWAAVAWVGPLVQARLPTLSAATRARRIPVVGTATVVALVAVLVAVTATADGPNDERRDEAIMPFSREAAAAIGEAADGRPIRLQMEGAAALLTVGPAIAARLVDAGHEVRVHEPSEDFWSHRARPPEPGELEVRVLGAATPRPPDEGTLATGALPIRPGGASELFGATWFAAVEEGVDG